MGGTWRNGFAGLANSHVNILPLACPPAMVEWSAERAMEVTGPDSTAERNLALMKSSPELRELLKHTFCSRPNDRFETLVIVKYQYYAF